MGRPSGRERHRCRTRDHALWAREGHWTDPDAAIPTWTIEGSFHSIAAMLERTTPTVLLAFGVGLWVGCNNDHRDVICEQGHCEC